MPVLTKVKYNELMTQLINRWDNLKYCFVQRELNSPKEGAARGHWTNPRAMCATNGTSTELSLAIEDFKTILAEIKKLK